MVSIFPLTPYSRCLFSWSLGSFPGARTPLRISSSPIIIIIIIILFWEFFTPMLADVFYWSLSDNKKP